MLETLPPLQRLALAYAPRSARLPTLALLALDTRLAGIVRNSHEPMLAQLRLAWWREQLAAAPAATSRGEPLLTALASWNGHQAKLTALVDGWEQLIGAAPLSGEAFLAFATARGAAFAALASAVGVPGDAEKARALGRRWALADLAVHIGQPEEGRRVAVLLAAEPRPGRTGRRMRPLTVLEGLARRRADRGNLSRGALLLALRLGFLGR